MSCRDELFDGADFEGYEGFCNDLVNMFKNNWRQSDPQTALIEAQPGMIASDSDDEKLYHKLGAGGPASGACQPSGSPEWDEVLQARMSCDVTPVFDSVDLGDNAIRTDTRARVYLSSEQSNIPDTTWTQVLVDTINFDSGGNVDLANNKIVAPVLGLYLCIGAVLWKGSSVVADKTYWSAIYINGVARAVDNRHGSHIGSLSCIAIDVRIVAQGQDIELYCYHNAGAATPDVQQGPSFTYLAVHLLSI